MELISKLDPYMAPQALKASLLGLKQNNKTHCLELSDEIIAPRSANDFLMLNGADWTIAKETSNFWNMQLFGEPPPPIVFSPNSLMLMGCGI